jgi:uncharacterized protein YecE (DUF72 family)
MERHDKESVLIGLAGWSEAASRHGKLLPAAGEGATGLQRYAAAFDFVEINSSFYRQVKLATYEKWAGEVSADFRFAVKMHRLITHYTRLKNTDLLKDFFASVEGLGKKLAVVLVQLPPTLVFDSGVAEKCFAVLRSIYQGCVVCEPRHPSWEAKDAQEVLGSFEIGTVLTEIPSEETGAKHPARCCPPVYVRLHGAPRKYYSSYSAADLARLAGFLAASAGRQCHVVFDNTAGPAGVLNALELQKLVLGVEN